jgi:hypothetical protein
MDISTQISRADTDDGGGGQTPRIELDLPIALSAIHTGGLQVVPDTRGGTILDVGHPTAAPLLPYLPATGTWAWVADAAGVVGVRRAERPVGTVVLDGRAHADPPGRGSRPDLVVRTVDQFANQLVVDQHGGAPRPGVLIDLTEAAAWRIGSRLLAAPAGVAGFHLDLAGPARDRMPERIESLAHTLRRWRAAGRSARPLLVLRGARIVVARRAVAAVLRTCRARGLPVPVIRVDVTGTVVDVAVRTVVRVLGVETPGGAPVLEVDALPRCVGDPLRVLGATGFAAPPADVLLRHRGRLVSARICGPALAGCELSATGCIDECHPLVVRGFPAVAAGRAVRLSVPPPAAGPAVHNSGPRQPTGSIR